MKNTAKIIFEDDEGRQPIWKIEWMEVGLGYYGWVILKDGEVWRGITYTNAKTAGMALDIAVQDASKELALDR